MQTQTIDILLADDHAMLREVLSAELDAQSQFRVIGTACNADEAIGKAFEVKPHIIVMDIDMPGMICFDAARTITSAQPETRIIFLSAFFSDHYIEQAIAVKARGYVTKRESAQVIVQAIRTVAEGGTFFSEDVQRRLTIDSNGVSLASRGATRAT